MLWTFPTYSTPDVAFFTFILTISSREKARAAGRVGVDAIAGPDGYESLRFKLTVVAGR